MREVLIRESFLPKAESIAEEKGCEVICASNVNVPEGCVRITIRKKEEVKEL